MASSISFIAKYIDPEKQKELAIKLSQNLDKDDDLNTLCDLAEFLSEDVIDTIYPQILEFSVKSLTDFDINDDLKERNSSSILKFLEKFPKLCDDLLKFISNHLNTFITTSQVKFMTLLHPLITECVTEKQILDMDISTNGDFDALDFIKSLLLFVERLYMCTTRENETMSIDGVILYFLGMNDEEVSLIASKIIRWRINNIIAKYRDADLVWNIIYILQSSDLKYHKANSYILWLRYLNNSIITQSGKFDRNIVKHEYWLFLQNGLISDYHEHRKFALSILKLTVQNIRIDIDTNIMLWDCSKKDLYMKEWERFTTLFEILGIDTSLHQSQAASQDIIHLMSPNSLVHSSWGFCLLSTGFKATMESIRKFSLGLLLSIPRKNLFLFKDGLKYFENIYLPSAMLAAHFIVRQKEDVNENYCEYGEILMSYIKDMVISFKNEADLSNLVSSILRVLVSLKNAFDPARIYVALGLLKGLAGKNILNSQHLEYLTELFEVDAEGELFETSIQTINLRFLLYVDLGKVGVTGFLHQLATFVKFNGFKLVVADIDLFIDYFVKNIEKDELVSIIKNGFAKMDTNLSVILIGLSLEMHLDIEHIQLLESIKTHSDTNQLLIELYLSEFQIVDLLNDSSFSSLYKSIVMNLSDGVGADSLYEKSSNDLFINDTILFDHRFWSTIDCTGLWKSINCNINSKDQSKIKHSLNQLQFLNAITKKIIYNSDNMIDIWNFEKLYDFNSILSKLPVQKVSKDFYKTKDELYDQYYKLLLNSFEINDITPEFITKLISILKGNMDITAYYQSYISLTTLLSFIISGDFNLSSSDVAHFVKILITIWKDLIDERLILNQRDLHLLIIETLYHPQILSHSVSNVSIADDLLYFGKSVIECSTGRRCLLPTLSKKISNYQIHHQKEFESTYWLKEVLVRGFILSQLKNNIFKLENIIGKLYDSQIRFVGDIYKETYGLDEISSRINLLTILSSIETSDFAWSIIEFIDQNEEEFHLYKVIRLTDGAEEWKRIQLYTIIITIFDKIVESKVFPEYVKRFITYLHKDPSPLARVYIEWIISLNLLKSDELTEFIFTDLVDYLENGNKPNTIAAYERILYLMTQHLPVDKETELLSRLLAIIIPASTSNKAITRHFSLSLICSIFPEILKKQLKIDPNMLEILQNMFTTATKSEAFDQYRSGDALLWDIKKDFTLVSLTGGVLLRLTDRNVDFITKETFYKNLSEEQLEFARIPVGENLKELWVKERKNQYQLQLQNRLKNLNISATEQSPLQTKSGAWSSIMDIDAQQQRGGDVKRSDLIVVSSLVDKAPNLGGICRLCDVLGAGLLTVHDIKIKNHSQFKSVAVTADQWMPILELKPEDIISFFKEKKKEGYTLIGLEQTDKSVVLDNELKFPKKSLILLGREKEGVPGELLAELDFCVEIKQVGVVRSMNIQTATAVIVHAYSSQHC